MSVDAARDERRARNEALFREVNERIEDVSSDLADESEQEVRRSHLGVAVFGRELLGGGHRLLGLDCEAIRLHSSAPLHARFPSPAPGARRRWTAILTGLAPLAGMIFRAS